MFPSYNLKNTLCLCNVIHFGLYALSNQGSHQAMNDRKYSCDVTKPKKGKKNSLPVNTLFSLTVNFCFCMCLTSFFLFIRNLQILLPLPIYLVFMCLFCTSSCTSTCKCFSKSYIMLIRYVFFLFLHSSFTMA